MAAADPSEPEPELDPGGAGNGGNREDELELIRAMFEEELSIPSLDDPYTFSLKLSVLESGQHLRSWTAPLILEVFLPTQDYPKATQLRVRCLRCNKRALRSLHSAMALALAEDHSVGDNGPRVCFAAQWLVDHAHRFFNVREVARNRPPARQAADAAMVLSTDLMLTQQWAEADIEDEEDETDDGEGGKAGGHGVDLCFCMFESLRPSLPIEASDTVSATINGDEPDGSWMDEAGRRRRLGASKHAAAAALAACKDTSTRSTAPVGKLLAQWARKKYFVGLLLRGAPALVVLQTNIAPEYASMHNLQLQFVDQPFVSDPSAHCFGVLAPRSSRHPNRATQRAKTLMSYASELGLTGAIALCVQTKDTGVGAVMRSIVAAADAVDGDVDENDAAPPVPAADEEMATNADGEDDEPSAVHTAAAARALLERAMVARRVMTEGRGLAVAEHSELLEFLTEAGCSPEQIASVLPGSTRSAKA
eukprot:COSAG02_NODE_2384_length_8991_cov_40.617521_2_plen_479_part_00